MTSATEKLAQTELEDRQEEDIKALKKKHACHKCSIHGYCPAQGKCSHCKGTGIEPDRRKEYERELKEIKLKYSLNPIE